MKWLIGNDGLLWFFKTSYGYISPRGLIQHVKFMIDLPWASCKYMRARYLDHKTVTNGQ